MAGAITKQLYIYSITAEPAIIEYLEDQLTASELKWLLYRAKRFGREKFEINEQPYEAIYDTTFHYWVRPVDEGSQYDPG